MLKHYFQYRCPHARILFFSFFLSLAAQFTSVPAATAEDWKGHTEASPVEVGVLTGAGIYGSATNWSVLATGAYLINPQGWANDIDNRVWAELEMGPAFFSSVGQSQTGFQYSAHLRWDFTYNEYWTFYGLGGLGGFVLPSYLGSTFTLHPRFGVGAEYQTKTALMFRGEVSSDLLALGVALNF